jgi:hypothetical protein
MKNHGYELEHNFGHGETDVVEPPWQAARQAAVKRSSFFAHILTLTSYVVFPSWSALLQALATSRSRWNCST